MKNAQDKSDIELVESCVKGDLGAWSRFTQKYSRLIKFSIENRLKKYGFTLLRQDIEDIGQDVLAYIWKDRKLEDVRNRSDISYWLAVVSGNAAMEYIRKHRHEPDLNAVRIFDKAGGSELADLIPADTLKPSEEVIASEILQRIDRSMEKLPSGERLVAKLNFYHGKKYHEIADILGMPGGTVSNYMKRAKEKLRKALRDFSPPSI